MPKKEEEQLKKEALKKFGTTTSQEARAYIYGTLRQQGWIPSTQKRSSKTRRILK